MDQYPARPERAANFDRAACIRNVFADEPRIHMLPLAHEESIEARYLADEMTGEDGSSHMHLASMETAAAEISQRLRYSGELTEDDISQNGDEAYEESRRSFGDLIISFAKQAELARSLRPEEVASIRSTHHPYSPAELGLRMVESAKSGYLGFNNGWGIFKTEEAGPILVKLSGDAQDGSETFDIAYLDEVFETNPDFLRHLIRTHHEAEARHGVIERATYYPRLHEVAPSEIIPDFMAELGGVEDAEQRAQESRAIRSYLNLLWAVAAEGSDAFRVGGWDHEDQPLGRFQYNVISAIKLEDGRHLYTDHYLEHMAQCPGQPEDDQSRATELLELYRHIQELGARAPTLSPEQRRYIPVLETPHNAMNAARVIQRLEREISEQTTTSGSDAQPRMLAELRRVLPLAEEFRQEVGITDADLQRLTQLSESDTAINFFRIRNDIYTPLFNALALHRQGAVNMNSSTFKSLLRTYTGARDLDLDSVV